MSTSPAVGVIVMVAAFAASAALAQPAAPSAALDPSHVGVLLPKNVKWEGKDGEYRAPVFGDPAQPGLYAYLVRWEPGHNSHPHSHSMDRVGYVLSGTWWTSTSTIEDKATMVPIPAGSYVHHVANTVHWDGAKADTAVILLVGMGPVTTTPAATAR